jgi:hypothetical protein
VVALSRWAALALLAALPCWSRAAVAQVPDAAVAPASRHEVPASREASYRGLLTTSYVLAPFLALGVGHLLSEGEAEDEIAALGAGTMFLVPAGVHMAHGNVAHGPLSFLGLAGSTGVSLLLGGFVGYNLGALGCDPAEDSEGCDFAGINGLVAGALLGGVTGYTAFAIYDVSANGAVALDEAPPADHASLGLWLSPMPAAKNERGEATAPFGGLQIGASLQM